LNYVSDRQTGEPVEGAELFLFSPKTERITAKTSGDGIADVSIEGRKPEDIRVLARKGADVAANVLESYNFASNEDRWASYIYTDRPVYRPGHTVRFKGIFRMREPDGYTLPKEVELPVKIEDAAGNTVFQKSLALNQNGTLNGEFTLAANASLGYYFMQFQAGERFMSASFEV
jgi:uncharacterized protein YfaS (alpha-2-macroglobulin family)